MWGYTIKVGLENKSSDKTYMFSVATASVNGVVADPFFATSIPTGKCRFTSMSWSDSALEENDITEIEEIEFKLRVYDSENWNASDFFNDIITVTP